MTAKEYFLTKDYYEKEGKYTSDDVIELMEEYRQLFMGSAHYKWLLERDAWLTCLESAGVDNWSGYGHALDLKNEYNDDNA